MLKDKINYKLFQALDDPEAATFAAEQAQQQADQTAVVKKEKKLEDAKIQREKELAEAEANKPKTPLEAMGSTTMKVLLYGAGAYLAASYGSMAANTAIHRHPLLRILFFIFGSIVGLVVLIFSLPLPPLLIGLVITHIVMRRLNLLPHEYNFLPLMQYEPTNNIIYELLQNYIIAWDPSNEKHKEHYVIKLKDYMSLLGSSRAVAAESSVKEENK